MKATGLPSNNHKPFHQMKTITRNELQERLGAFRSVRSDTSAAGNPNPNHFIIRFDNGVLYQSYRSLVVARLADGTTYLREDHDYSRTTCKFVKGFTGKNAEERRRALERGEYGFIEE